MGKKKPNEVVENTQIIIEKPAREVILVKVQGTSQYSPNRLDPAKVIQMRKDIEKPITVKKKRNLDEEYESCFYIAGYTKANKPIYGIPGGAFKSAIIDASLDIENVAKTQMKRNIAVMENIVPIKYDNIQKEIFTTRDSGQTRAPNVAMKPLFNNWSASIRISYDTSVFSRNTIYNLINRAGIQIGIGSMRPSKNGPITCGTFEVAREQN